jgi:FG-GAP repeat
VTGTSLDEARARAPAREAIELRKIAILFAVTAVVAALMPVSADAGTTSRRELRQRTARHLLTGTAAGRSSSAATGGSSVSASGDFNNDNRQDLVIGASGEDANEGAIHLFLGGANGPRTDNDQIIRLTDFCGGVWSANGEDFGRTLAAGDFNGDGRDDLAVGAPGSAPFGVTGGLVLILNGAPGGFDLPNSCQAIYENNGGAPGLQGTAVEASDQLGSALAVGNFGNGSRDDLAISVVGEDGSAGAVYVLYGTPTGLVDNGGNSISVSPSTTYLSQSQLVINGVAEPGDLFGYSLAAGNVGFSPHSDLAVGAPGEATNEQVQSGVAHVLYGSPTGISLSSDVLLSQNSDGMKDDVDEFDVFGYAMAIGNFGRSGHGDLAVGVPEEDIGTTGFLAGAVAVVYGSSGGVTSKGNQLFSQSSPGVPDNSENSDLWGYTLATANFGRSSQSDLVIGAPLENLGTIAAPLGTAGTATVLYGSSSGLRGTGAQLWSQRSQGIADAVEAGDAFGFGIAGGNYGKSSHADLVVGVLGEDFGAVSSAGAAHVIFGSANGLTRTGARFLRQGANGVADTAENGDSFGISVN